MAFDRDSFRPWGRWLATFVGFPLGGVAARLVAGDIDAGGAAIAGGLAGGLVLGGLQSVIGGLPPAQRVRWIGATGAGLSLGLLAGGEAVGFRTDTASLVAMGALSGASVGLFQAVAMSGRLTDRFAWAIATPALWALGWLITSQVIVDADRHHAMFGSSGALTVSALAGVLQAIRMRAEAEISSPAVSLTEGAVA